MRGLARFIVFDQPASLFEPIRKYQRFFVYEPTSCETTHKIEIVRIRRRVENVLHSIKYCSSILNHSTYLPASFIPQVPVQHVMGIFIAIYLCSLPCLCASSVPGSPEAGFSSAKYQTRSI